MQQDIARQIKVIGLLSFIPLTFGVWPIAGFFLGRYLQDVFKGPNYLPILVALLGFLLGIREIIRILKMVNKDNGSRS